MAAELVDGLEEVYEGSWGEEDGNIKEDTLWDEDTTGEGGEEHGNEVAVAREDSVLDDWPWLSKLDKI